MEYVIELKRVKGARDDFKSIGFKNKSIPLRLRDESELKLTTFTITICGRYTLREEFSKVVSDIESLGILISVGAPPFIGARCIGKLELAYIEDESFDRYLWR